jgi:hypothetical protein
MRGNRPHGAARRGQPALQLEREQQVVIGPQSRSL